MSRGLGIGLGVILLAAPGLARAQDTCTERLEPDGFRDRLSQVGTSGDAAVGAQLDSLEQLAESCIDGPISAGDLAGLFMAQALWEVSRDGGDLLRVQERLAWAAALVGESALRPEHEPLRDAFDAALAAATQRGTLDLEFSPVPDVMVLDGQVEYDLGPRSAAAGAHLVQWLSDGSWTGRLVLVDPGGTGTLSVGEPAPAEVEASAPGSMGSIDVDTARAEVVDQWLGGALFLQRYAAQVSDGLRVWEATALAPGGRVEGRLMALDWLSLGGQATVAPGGDPAVLSRARAELGAGWGGFFRGELIAGVAAAAIPSAASATLGAAAGSPPVFTESLAVGPSLRVRGAAGDTWRIALSAGGARLGLATELSGDAALGWRGRSLAPVLRVAGGQLSQPGLGGVEDRYRWVGGELGARWIF